MSDNGTEVDVDFTADGSTIFDLWRLRQYGLSLPEPLDVTDDDLRAAVRSLQPLLGQGPEFPSKAPRLIRLTRSSQASHLTCFRAPQ
ncbi:DUF6896 domain-containing protein [Streptomyces anulatus]|uniref:DUF6896 domain-containing protein n=1 Tax=Streptomyces anulatus TaxID=1892 RepID=UPI003810A4B9